MSPQSRMATPETAVRTGILVRALIYTVLIVFAVYYLLPLYVMLVNSVKPLDEIRQGNMMSLPSLFTLDPWRSAWSTAQIGVQPTGLKPYFMNSVLMVIPAVAISTLLGALNGYVLTKWRFRGDGIVFGLLLFACFIPFQIVLIPMARILGLLGLAGSTPGLVLVHVVYGLGFTTQGSVETSNVNVVEELVNMIETQRAYEMNSKAISTADQMLEYVNNQL